MITNDSRRRGAVPLGPGRGPPFNVTLFNDVLNDVPCTTRITFTAHTLVPAGDAKRNLLLADNGAAGKWLEGTNVAVIEWSEFYGCLHFTRSNDRDSNLNVNFANLSLEFLRYDCESHDRSVRSDRNELRELQCFIKEFSWWIFYTCTNHYCIIAHRVCARFAGNKILASVKQLFQIH